MTIVGVILCFRQLGQEALNDVLNQRVPFLLSSIIDFKEHFPADEGDATVRYQLLEFHQRFHHIIVTCSLPGGERNGFRSRIKLRSRPSLSNSPQSTTNW